MGDEWATGCFPVGMQMRDASAVELKHRRPKAATTRRLPYLYTLSAPPQEYADRCPYLDAVPESNYRQDTLGS